MQKHQLEEKIIIAAGGTGGHLFPAQALALDLMKKNKKLEVIFMSHGLSKSPYFRKEYFSFQEISSGTPYKKSPLQIIKAIYALIKGTYQSFRYLKKFKPKVVVGFGSFYSFPILFASKLSRIPVILFESNAFPGKVNRLCSRWAKATAIHFLQASRYLKGKTICVRMPLLKNGEGISRKEAREYFQLDQKRLTFLVFGGSQGAQSINRFFCESLEKLRSKAFDFQVIHLVGSLHRAEKLKEVYRKYRICSCVKSFEERMDIAWSAADLCISRAGAATLAEQIQFGIPGILIPYPYASDNHQGINASFLENVIHGGIKLSENELTADRLVNVIDKLVDSNWERLRMMKRSLEEFKKREQKEDFCSLIFNYGGVKF